MGIQQKCDRIHQIIEGERLSQIALMLRERSHSGNLADVRSHSDDNRVRALVSDCIDVEGAIA